MVINIKKDESYIGAVVVCNRFNVQIEMIELSSLGVDFPETRVKADILFVTEPLKKNNFFFRRPLSAAFKLIKKKKIAAFLNFCRICIRTRQKNM